MEKTTTEVCSYSKIGEMHKRENMENQDCVYSAENQYTSFFAVADGVSACKNSKLGARLACEVCSEILLDHAGYYFNADAEKVKKILLTNIRSAIAGQAKQDRCTPKDYASTLTFLCVDELSDRILTFSLGDSRIYRIDDRGVHPVCQTVNREQGGICTTISCSAEKEAVVQKSDRQKKDKFLLCTDGMWRTAEAASLLDDPDLFQDDGTTITDLLDRQKIHDDCSFLLTV